MLCLVPVVTVSLIVYVPALSWMRIASDLYCFADPSPKSQMNPTGYP